MWEFVRSARAHSDLEGLEVFDALAAIEESLASWGNASESGDIWEKLFPSSDNPREEFIYTWDRIKWPRAELDRAQAQATSLPLKPHPCYSAGYGQFISIAGHLQRGVNGSILLPCVRIAQMLSCTPMAVSRYRKWAQSAGLLKLTAKGIKAQRKADEFVFAVDRFDWKTGEQIAPDELHNSLPSHQMLTRDSETQETERKQESQEKHERKEMQRESRTPFLPMKRKCAIKSGPYIPTSEELAEQLRKTAHLRGGK